VEGERGSKNQGRVQICFQSKLRECHQGILQIWKVVVRDRDGNDRNLRTPAQVLSRLKGVESVQIVGLSQLSFFRPKRVER
jgi:hypothetical protein